MPVARGEPAMQSATAIIVGRISALDKGIAVFSPMEVQRPSYAF
jgi:hypothetical protein